ncbi:MAG: ABC transporter permease [Actinobacteria bacterium]|nr:ABC transporter permease [Actinomycetota bacterium]
MTAALQRVRNSFDAAPRSARIATWVVAPVLVWIVGDNVLPRGMPLGIILVGAVFGALNALIAIGIVLVFKANKVVNFAQAEFGAVAAVLAIEFKLKLHWNYFLAIGAGLVIAVVLGALVEMLVIRRFRQAPRLILAVATIGLAQILNGISVIIPLKWSGLIAERFETPFDVRFKIFPVVFSGDHVLVMIVVPAVLIALTWFLRYTDYGVAIRAAAENGDRANLLGIPVARLSTVVWAISGLLSALAVVLRVPLLGFASFSSVSGGGFSLLLRTLAAAVIGGMTSLPITFVAAVGLGILQELGAWTFHTSTYVDALLLFVILFVFLSQRERFSRATETGISTWKALREVRPIPAELRSLPEVRVGLWTLRGLLAAGVLAFPLWAEPSQEQLAGIILIYAIVAVSLVVLTGWGGNISLGHWALVGFGACTTGTLVARHGWDLFLAIPAAMIVTGGVAFLIGLPALRISGPFLAVTTLAFAVTSSTYFLENRYFNWFVPDHVDRPPLWNRFRYDQDWQMYFVCLAGLVLSVYAVQRLRRSRTGRAALATRDNFQAAQSVAIETTAVKLAGFAISGAIAGLAGSLYVLHQQGFKTDSFGPEESLRLFSMVVIGGLGSVPGAILGATYVRGTEFFLSGGYALIASGAGLVLLLLILPGGLGELVYRARDAMLRRVARRRGLVVPSLVADVRVGTEDAPVALGAALSGLDGATNGDGKGHASNGHAPPEAPRAGELEKAR